MSLKRDELDTFIGITKHAAVLYHGFLSLAEDRPDAFNLVSEYRLDIETRLHDLDQRMCAIMTNLNNRTLWADRMRTCHNKMRVLTMNLAVWGKPEWSWEEVAEAMGQLRAIVQGAQTTLAINEPVVPENALAP